MANKRLILYGRDDCHLCHDMIDLLQSVRGELNFDLEVVDIDNSPELVARYQTLIPVLVHGSIEICHYFLDMERLRSVLASTGE